MQSSMKPLEDWLPIAFAEVVAYLAAFGGRKRQPSAILRDWGVLPPLDEARQKELDDEALIEWAMKVHNQQKGVPNG